MFDPNEELGFEYENENNNTQGEPPESTYSSGYYSEYNTSQPGAYYSQPNAPPPTKKKRRETKLKYAAVLLAVSICSGAVGGGMSYWLMNDSTGMTAGSLPANTAPVVQESTASSGFGSDIASIAAKASASVVEITVESTEFIPFFGEAASTGSGSGVVVSQDGYIVTNSHVVGEAGVITVRTTDGDEYPATLIGTDSKTDLAVIKIDAAALAPATFANSDQIQVGELAVAIGNSLGTLGGTVTDGIISAKDRDVTIDNETMTLLQTSAAVNPGNSGGGLFNSNGDLVGIVNAKSTGTEVEGLGFAIPSNLVKAVADNIMENGYVTGRPELGISILEIKDPQAAAMYRLSEYGVYIMEVSKENGLQPGDRILSVNGNEIEGTGDIKAILEEQAVGEIMDFVVYRNEGEVSVSVTVGEQIPDYMQQRLAESSSV